jgi:hypothetical protein
MAPLSLNFGLSSQKGRFKLDNSAELLNCFAEPLMQGGRAQVMLRSSPGLRPFAQTGGGAYRGGYVMNRRLYVVCGAGLYRVDTDGTATEIAGIAGSGPVMFARNAMTDADVMIGASGATYHMKNEVVTKFESDAMPEAEGVSFIKGRFVFPIADGRFFCSNINSTTIFGDSFYNAEGRPDGLVRSFARRQELWLFGEESFEIWAITGDDSDPFSQLGGGAKSIGCISAGTVTEMDDRIFWIDDNAQVRMATGYDGQVISTPQVTRKIEAEPDKSAIRCDAYQLDGFYWLTVSAPTFTEVYNITTGQWTGRQTGSSTRWRGRGAVKFDNKIICGDIENGDLYQIDMDYHRDGTEPVVMRLRSPVIHAFPAPLSLYSLHLDALAGPEPRDATADDESDPQVMMRISRDGGGSWSGRLYEPLGRQGEAARCVFRQLGTVQRQGAVVEISISAPIAKAVTSGLFNAESGTA